MIGICPNCKKTLEHVNIEPVRTTYNLFANITWIAVSCPRCHTVISVQPQPRKK